MNGRFVSVFLLAMIAITVYAEPLRRRRRQSGPDASSLISAPCPVQCSWSFSQAWAKAISFETPTANMIPDRFLAGKNDTFSVICAIYEGYSMCLRGCTAGNSDTIPAVRASPTYVNVCTARQAEFDQYVPCLLNNTKLFQRSCQQDNENLLAASVRLNTQRKLDSTVRDFCNAANVQMFCVFPILRQTCGDGPYDAIRSIINASLVSVRASVRDDVIEAFYPECSIYFDTIVNGINTPTTFGNRSASSNSTVTESTTTTPTTANSTFDLLRRDDADGPTYETKGGRFGATVTPRPRNPTTTPSSHGVVHRFNSAFTFFTIIISALFSAFLFM